MASSSRPRAGSSRSGGPSRPSGGGNAVAYLAAAVVVVLVVVLFISMNKKKEPPPTPSKPATPVAPAPAAPAKPAEKPYPPLLESKKREGAELAASFPKDIAEAERIYKESLKAKEAGDDAAWQSKLNDVSRLANSINDRWNEFIATLPESKDYDGEQVARHYFYKESGIAARAGKLLSAMKSDQR
ncbi:MAG TPA: hypothetical protein VND21_08295 [Planctomycetota bacterium]|nr:hypothetical protein [Planctomycetota bacterium]